MSDVGAVAGAVTSIVDTIRPFLEEGLAQRYDKEFYENINKIQEAFNSDNLDDIGNITQQLLIQSGHPATPSRDPEVSRRNLFHSLLLVAADCIRERKYVASYSYASRKS